MFRNMASSLIIYEGIETTQVRAKEVQKQVERLITVGKQGTLESKRRLSSVLTEKSAADKVRKELVPRYKDRSGGYTRIIKIGPRKGDSSYQVRIELV